MTELYTSYYAGLKGIDLKKFKPFSISTGNYKFLDLPKVEPLCPDRVMQCGKYEWRDMPASEYTARFLDGLKRMDSSGELLYIFETLKGLSGEANPLLLCFEKFESECFCHRHIIGKYLNQNYGVRTYEIVGAKKYSYDFSINRNAIENISEVKNAREYEQLTLF